MIWPSMLADFAQWRDDPDWVRRFLPTLRSLLAVHESYLSSDWLLQALPGWPFVDWVPDWKLGCGPGVREGDSSIVNLHWIQSNLYAADIERAYGDRELADRCERLARECMESTLKRYWDNERGLLRDSSEDAPASEHAQALALLTGLLDSEKEHGALNALLEQRAQRVVIDLRELHYIASMTLAELIHFRRELQAYGGHLRLAGASAPIVSVFETTHLADLFPMYPTAEQALDENA